MSLNNLPPDFYDAMKIAGQDKHNSEMDKLKQQSISNQQHKEKIQTFEKLTDKVEFISNSVSEHEKNQKITERKQRRFNWFTFIFSALISLGSLIVAIIALTH